MKQGRDALLCRFQLHSNDSLTCGIEPRVGLQASDHRGVHEVLGGATQRHKQLIVVRIDGRTTTRGVRRNEYRLIGDL